MARDVEQGEEQSAGRQLVMYLTFQCRVLYRPFFHDYLRDFQRTEREYQNEEEVSEHGRE